MDRMLAAAMSRPRWLMSLAGMVLILTAGQLAFTGLPRLGLTGLICGPGAAVSLPGLMAIWAAMTLAMMLPAALPMISAYLDIAAAAAEKRMRVVAPVILVSGYLAVWLLAGLLLAGAQWAAQGLAADPLLVAGLFVLAGGWQFSSLKHACLSKCRQPMPYFMANWSEAPGRVFAMGLEQGALCLGCCWALMTLMFAAGTMNALWMAGLGLAMILEKTLPKPEPFSRALGGGLILAGVSVAIRSLAS